MDTEHKSAEITEARLSTLERKFQESEQRFRGFFESSGAGMAICDTAGHCIRVNQAFSRLLGYTEDELIGMSLCNTAYVDDRAGFEKLFQQANAEADMELRFVRKDGETIWGHFSLVPHRLGPETTFSFVIQDVTLQKRAEALLRESEERFRVVADDTPAFLWYSQAQVDETFLNRSFAEFLGTPPGTMLNNKDLVEKVIHPDDVAHCLGNFQKAVEARTDYLDEYRVRRRDGEYRIVQGRARPRFSLAGTFLGYAGSAIDITDLRQTMEQLKVANSKLERELAERIRAESELRAMGERLITAQENERARLARELHDDFGQRMAAVSLSLSDLRQRFGSQASDAMAKIQVTQARVMQLASDMREVSHRLHPALLEYAGLMTALRSCCDEFTSISGIEVSFCAEDDLPEIHPDVSLCVYRVTQEALQNIARHAGVRRAEVRLEQVAVPDNWSDCVDGMPQCLQVVISDKGVGFDPAQVERHASLGLLSMRERARAVNGTTKFESSPGNGTTVTVRVPLVLVTHP